MYTNYFLVKHCTSAEIKSQTRSPVIANKLHIANAHACKMQFLTGLIKRGVGVTDDIHKRNCQADGRHLVWMRYLSAGSFAVTDCSVAISRTHIVGRTFIHYTSCRP
ncbi:hypothetical protein EVAR_50610_1 [Eumeta japonica]|uniref:Uncharacterized protein n=1 Tax=Eumeta variegata TaxID=151549 RepID=A0A4C1Y7U8_EUMVA|nr:hypothetical protein EVAR_50610_1 [Eumeta japonica]